MASDPSSSEDVDDRTPFQRNQDDYDAFMKTVTPPSSRSSSRVMTEEQRRSYNAEKSRRARFKKIQSIDQLSAQAHRVRQVESVNTDLLIT